MNKKEKESAAMNALFDGLTKTEPQPSETSPISQNVASKEESVEVKQKHVHTQRVCVLIEDEVLAKIRAISEKESLSLSSIYNLGLKVVVENYERNHGKVKPKQRSKGDIDKIFNI